MKFVLLFAIAMQGGTSIPSNQKTKIFAKLLLGNKSPNVIMKIS
jgi:hypothetical protein